MDTFNEMDFPELSPFDAIQEGPISFDTNYIETWGDNNEDLSDRLEEEIPRAEEKVPRQSNHDRNMGLYGP